MDIKPFCNTDIELIDIEDLKKKLLSIDATNVVLLMTESGAKRWHLESFLNELKETYNLVWICNCPTNPTQVDVANNLKDLRDNQVDVIIAIGGGSVIDMAKAISTFYCKTNILDSDDIKESIDNKAYLTNEKFIDIIAVPTTAGTGSEITQWATIWEADSVKKYSIDSPEFKPKLALVCHEFTMTASDRITLSTGLDAMMHAMEAFWSRHTNDLVKDISSKSIDLIANNLRQCIDYSSDEVSRKALCRASILSALAFSQTRTTACHSISYPLTSMFGIEHGLAVAMTLPEMYEVNYAYTNRMNEIDNIFEEFGGIRQWMKFVCDGIVELRLQAFGVSENDIDSIVDNAFTAGRMDNNPVDLDKMQVRDILKKCL